MQLSSFNYCKKTHKLRTFDCYKTLYLNHIYSISSSKFSFLKKELAQPYTLRKYITSIDHPQHRSTIAKLRTHSHCLLEESHIYLNCSSTCQNCTLDVTETPFHFLLKCDNTKLKQLRQSLVNRLNITNDNELMIYEDLVTGNMVTNDSFSVYKTINDMYEERRSLDIRQHWNTMTITRKPAIVGSFITGGGRGIRQLL